MDIKSTQYPNFLKDKEVSLFELCLTKKFERNSPRAPRQFIVGIVLSVWTWIAHVICGEVEVQIRLYATQFVGKVCGSFCSSWGMVKLGLCVNAPLCNRVLLLVLGDSITLNVVGL